MRTRYLPEELKQRNDTCGDRLGLQASVEAFCAMTRVTGRRKRWLGLNRGHRYAVAAYELLAVAVTAKIALAPTSPDPAGVVLAVATIFGALHVPLVLMLATVAPPKASRMPVASPITTTREESNTRRGFPTFGVLSFGAFAIATAVVPLGVLYFLVRFVKWAWTN